jgi:hypothetical protein
MVKYEEKMLPYFSKNARPSTRKTLILLCALCAVSGAPRILAGQAEPTKPDLHGVLRADLQNIAMKELEDRSSRIARIQTREQVNGRQVEIRKLLLNSIGGLPDVRSPLNVRHMGTLDRGDYRVEKIIYESLPKFYVTANLYVPQAGKPPYPAVLQPTGHSLAAKNRAFYQNLSLGLVKQGYVVLTYDPIGQGERRLFYDPSLEDSKVGGTTDEHEMVGIQNLLAGESIARYMIWDGMRSIDLLQSLPFVDPKRIGVAGCSGGGTLTAYLAALDSRLKVAASACYITDWEEQLKGTGPQDGEQQFPDELKSGLDHGDLIIAFAPKPYLICSTTEDFFPIEGARKTYAEVKRIYQIFDAGQKISHFVAPGGHGTPQPSREAIYGWMNEWLKGAPPGSTPEPHFETEYEQNLLCTPTGQVSTSLGGETASTLNTHRFLVRLPTRPPLKSQPDVDRLRARIKNEVLQITRYEPPPSPPTLQEKGAIRRNGYTLTRLMYEVDPGRYVPALLAVPDPAGDRKKSVLFMDERGMEADARPNGDVDQLAQLGFTVLALDPSGIGETTSDWHGQSASWFGPNGKVTWLALMVGKPLVGIRMQEIVGGIDVLHQKELLYGGKCLAFAKGFTGVDLLHTAVVDDRISGMILEGSLVSYAAIATQPIHKRVFEAVLPGVLGKYDLPDLVASVAPLPLRISNVRSPLDNVIFLRNAQKAYQYALASYAARGAPRNLEIGLRREDEPLASAYSDLRER